MITPYKLLDIFSIKGDPNKVKNWDRKKFDLAQIIIKNFGQEGLSRFGESNLILGLEVRKEQIIGYELNGTCQGDFLDRDNVNTSALFYTVLGHKNNIKLIDEENYSDKVRSKIIVNNKLLNKEIIKSVSFDLNPRAGELKYLYLTFPL